MTSRRYATVFRGGLLANCLLTPNCHHKLLLSKYMLYSATMDSGDGTGNLSRPITIPLQPDNDSKTLQRYRTWPKFRRPLTELLKTSSV